MQTHTTLHFTIALTYYCWSQTLQAAWATPDNIFVEPVSVTGGNTKDVPESSVESTLSFTSLTSCYDDSEALIEHEDVRMELMAINMQYLEHGSTLKACTRDGKESVCRLDFSLYHSNLHEVCEEHGGLYAEREHSIQCHNSDTDEELYYQFDNHPYCFPMSCDSVDVNKMITLHIDGVKRALEDHSGMHCLSDWEILVDANERYASGASQRYFHWDMLSYYSGLGLGAFLLLAF